jgi:hypothetical protein
MNTRGPLFLPWLLLPFGLGLILAAFMLLIPEADRQATTWLGLVVVSTVFILNFLTVMVRLRGHEHFDAQVARLTLMVPAVTAYSVLAIGGVILGAAKAVPFNWQLLAQGACVFVFLSAYFSSSYAHHAVQSAGTEEAQRRDSLESLKALLERVGGQLTLVGGDLVDLRAAHARLAEDARFLSPCDTAEALRLENEIGQLLGQAGLALQSVSADPAALSSIFTRAGHLMAMRRQQRQPSGVTK